MRTYTPKADEIERKWWVVVVVINATQVKLTGKKADQKTYFRHSGYMGGEKHIPFRRMIETHPERVIELAVRGMLPKNIPIRVNSPSPWTSERDLSEWRRRTTRYKR
jgi:ribosomal protein L13